MEKFTRILPLLLLPVLATLGCIKERTKNGIVYQPIDTSTQPVDTTSSTDTTYSFLALGDSYTIGQGVQPTERFAAQMALFLRNYSIVVNEPVYIAATGWTTTNLINAISLQNPPKTFDIVTLLIGVNDQFQRQDTSGYRVRFKQLLNTAISLAAGKKARVFVLSIPDYSVTPFVPASDKARVSMEIDWFNAINKSVTAENNVTYLDITPSTRQAAADPQLLANDGLHPSGKEYEKWAKMLAPLIFSAL